MSSAGRSTRGNPGWAASEDDLRDLVAPGYHSAQQFRAVETTRKLVAAAWDSMAAHPAEPLRLDEVLAVSGTSASSFYSRFDSVRALVTVCGLLAVAVDDRDRSRTDEVPSWSSPVDHDGAVAAATTELFAPITEPGRLPREVLATGPWDDALVEARSRVRSSELQRLAFRVADRVDEAVDDGRTFNRTLTWLHLVAASVDVAWAVGRLAVPQESLEALAPMFVVLGRRALVPSPAAIAAALEAEAPVPQLTSGRAPVSGRSDRGARAMAELRDATRDALVEHGRDVAAADIARSVHRSRSAFFDAFGTMGVALADLARAQQVARIPTELFRPRAEVGPPDLLPHLAHRITAWQDHQGIVGRRLLQSASDHPELAAEVAGQLLDSVELLTGWYAPMFDLSPSLVRVVFALLLMAEQHQVVWGRRPAVVAGPEAVRSLFAPVTVEATTGSAPATPTP